MKRPEAQYEWSNGFGAGFVCGMGFMAIVMLIFLSLAGCKIVPPPAEPVDREARRARLVEASNRAAAYADSVWRNAPSDTTSTERKDP